MGNLTLHSAEEPDNLRATTGTVEVPTIRDNDAAHALGARPIQQHKPAAHHKITHHSYYSNQLINNGSLRFSLINKCAAT